MVVIIDHFIKLCDVAVAQLCPNLYFQIYLFQVVDYLVLPLCIIADRTLHTQGGLVHHFHGKFVLDRVIIARITLGKGGAGPSHGTRAFG